MSDKKKETAVSEPPKTEATKAAATPPDAPKAEPEAAAIPQPPEPPAAGQTESKQEARPMVELKHKDTMFFDSLTGFEIVRDERKELTKPVGKATQTAIESGRLLIVK